MVLVDDANQLSWIVVVDAGISWPTIHALTSVGTVETASSHQVRGKTLAAGPIRARIVAPDAGTAKDIVELVLPLASNVTRVEPAT